jgi:hypothetical protein
MLNGLHEVFAKMREGTSRCLVAIRWSGLTPIVFGAHRSLANTCADGTGRGSPVLDHPLATTSFSNLNKPTTFSQIMG